MAPPASPRSTASQDPGSDISDFIGERNLKQHLWSLATRDDLEHFASRVERAFKQDIEQLKADTTQLGGRMETLEQKFEEALPFIALMKDQCIAQDQKTEALLCQLYDFEKHSR